MEDFYATVDGRTASLWVDSFILSKAAHSRFPIMSKSINPSRVVQLPKSLGPSMYDDLSTHKSLLAGLWFDPAGSSSKSAVLDPNAVRMLIGQSV